MVTSNWWIQLILVCEDNVLHYWILVAWMAVIEHRKQLNNSAIQLKVAFLLIATNQSRLSAIAVLAVYFTGCKFTESINFGKNMDTTYAQYRRFLDSYKVPLMFLLTHTRLHKHCVTSCYGTCPCLHTSNGASLFFMARHGRGD